MEAEERPSNERSRSRAEPCRARVQNGEGRADHAEAPISSRRCLADCAESADQKAGADAHLLGLLRDVGILERGLLRSARAQRESRRTLRPPATLQIIREVRTSDDLLVRVLVVGGLGRLGLVGLLLQAALEDLARVLLRLLRRVSGIGGSGRRTSLVLGLRPSAAARITTRRTC